MSMKELTLSRGLVAWIDEEDWPVVAGFKWHAAKRDRTFYAASNRLRRRGYYLHRLLMKPGPGQHVDHINGNGLDNRRQNLRLCSNAQNRRNSRKTRGASLYKGVAVCRMNPGRPWEAYIWFENRKIGLGNYPTEEEAARAYNAAALELHGEFARLNHIEGLTYEESVVAPVRNRRPGRPPARPVAGVPG